MTSKQSSISTAKRVRKKQSIKRRSRTIEKKLRAGINNHNKKLSEYQKLGGDIYVKIATQLAKWGKGLNKVEGKAASSEGD